MVRVIRTFRPDVICTRFQGAARDGHGNHQASGILTREAFHAAADPTRFPEQIREGLQPWQAKKLYMDNVHANEDWTIKLETSQLDPLLGESLRAVCAGRAASISCRRERAAGHCPEGRRYQLLQADRLGVCRTRPCSASARERFLRWHRHLAARRWRRVWAATKRKFRWLRPQLAGNRQDGGRGDRGRRQRSAVRRRATAAGAEADSRVDCQS